MKPFCNIYSSFSQRAYDQLVHDAALQNLPVTLCLDRAGLVGEDGPTHHGAFDVGYLRQIPGMVVLSPVTAQELEQALYDAVYLYDGPVAIRYPRGKCAMESEVSGYSAPVFGARATLVSYGETMKETVRAAVLLSSHGIKAETVQLQCLKPLDLAWASNSKSPIFVIEDTVLSGCIGQEIAATTSRPTVLINLCDRFVTHGAIDKLFSITGLDAESICKRVMEVLEHEE